eukprot:TRINITY_DN3276_c0_g1_i2.p1 TRINITY_DN3276_c0_g1~~TRINITY_DN3276_c0_g1_i2.p1  ORF type:complete len:1663 (+),score=442.61 TRINITY_DN3276_c0_g1_i2:141-5129(+)
MEVILEGSDGCPRDCVLSIKVGDTKRQAPLTKVGQAFRFTTSSLEPIPLKVELHVPAAKSQTVAIDPAAPAFLVDFGGGKTVRLRHQLSQQQQPRTAVDVGQVAESRSLPSDKMELAQAAAGYLEKHGLVQLFQDMLHGILASRPDDPLQYIQDRVARTQGKPAPPAAQPSATPPPPAKSPTLSASEDAGLSDKGTVDKTAKSRRRSTMCGSVKVDALLSSLTETHSNLAIVLPLMPPELRSELCSPAFAADCHAKFVELDRDRSGSLTADELVPLIVELSNSKAKSVQPAHCTKLIELFDADKKGEILEDEFVALVQYVIIASMLESEGGQDILNLAKLEESEYSEFLDVIEKDLENLWTIIPFLPDDLRLLITSDDFVQECARKFKQLDADDSGSLDAEELIPLVDDMCEGLVTIDSSRCQRFVELFDSYGNGVIMFDEFVEFAQFLMVMNFLSTNQGSQVREQAKEAAEHDKSRNRRESGRRASTSKVDSLLMTLEETHRNLDLVMHLLPPDLRSALTSEAFRDDCQQRFSALDHEQRGWLVGEDLLPLICELSSITAATSILPDQCKQFVDMFDADQNGVITTDEFISLMQFVIIAHVLKTDEGMSLVDQAFAEECNYDKFIRMIEEDKANLATLLPFLPSEVVEHLVSDDFMKQCEQQFRALDKDGNGSLDAEELIPIVQAMSGSIRVDEERCQKFVKLFDTWNNGVIVFEEFIEFVQFMLVRSYLETAGRSEDVSPSGSRLSRQNEKAAKSRGRRHAMRRASTTKVDSLLASLEDTKDNLGLVLNLLPKEFRQKLENRQFKEECMQEFKKLDTENKGTLSGIDLIPFIMEISHVREESAVKPEQVKHFVALFDTDGNGVIDKSEFVPLVQYVLICSALQQGEGVFEQAIAEEAQYNDFIKMIEEDRENLWTVFPFLPQEMTTYLCSDSFVHECEEQFKALDIDESGSLDVKEVMPVLERMAIGIKIDEERCERFVEIFDVDQNGVIAIDEFVEFAQFMLVLNFLASAQGKDVKQQSDIYKEGARLAHLVKGLEDRPSTLMEVMQSVPKILNDELMSATFEQTVLAGFNAIEGASSGSLPVEKVVPFIAELMGSRPFAPTEKSCKESYDFFDKDAKDIKKGNIVRFARYCIVRSYLRFAQQSQDEVMVDVLVGRDRILTLLATLKENASRMSEIIPHLPESLTEELLSDEFSQTCLREFEELDTDGSGSLDPEELYPLIMAMSDARHFSLSVDHAREFVKIFDDDQNGVISTSEYTDLCRFVLIMAYLETAEGKLVESNMDVARGQKQIEDLLVKLESDRNLMGKILGVLPQELFVFLTSEHFVGKCHATFNALDKDKSKSLEPAELLPIVADLSKTQVFVVTEEQCARFLSLFDTDGNGVFDEDEFLEFSQFMVVTSYLQSEEGREACSEAWKVIEDSKRVEDLLPLVKQCRGNMQAIYPHLPDWLRKELLSDHFFTKCMDTFKALDVDGSGALEPREVYPLVQGLANAHELSIDEEQCKNFTNIFSESGSGYIRRDEFLNFCQFQIAMGYLESPEGQGVMDEVAEAERPASRCGDGMVSTDTMNNNMDARTQRPRVPSDPADNLAATTESRHLAIDVEFYQSRSDKLARENEDLRRKLRELEDSRLLHERQLEEKEMELRHARMETNSTSPSRKR